MLILNDNVEILVSSTELGHRRGMTKPTLDFEFFFKSLKRSQEIGQKPLVVLDIDSTLLHVHTRNQAILDDFINHREGHDFDEDVKQLIQTERLEGHHWGYESIRKKLSPTQWESLNQYWTYYFFSSHYLHHDVPVAGVDKFLKRLEILGVDIVYLTGRDEERMLQGTEHSFKNLVFPLHERAQLRLKKRLDQSDEAFKLDVLKELSMQYQNIWFFDNEPLNLQVSAQNLPQIQNVMVCTTHSGRGEAPPLTLYIKDFSEVRLGES